MFGSKRDERLSILSGKRGWIDLTNRVFVLFLLVILFDLPAPAMADVYTVSPSAGLNTVVIEGEIRPGDYEEFIHEIEHGQGRVH